MAQAGQRGPLGVADRAEAARPLRHRDRIRSADAGPAAGVDVRAAAFEQVQQAAPGLQRGDQIARLHLQLGGAGGALGACRWGRRGGVRSGHPCRRLRCRRGGIFGGMSGGMSGSHRQDRDVLAVQPHRFHHHRCERGFVGAAAAQLLAQEQPLHLQRAAHPDQAADGHCGAHRAHQRQVRVHPQALQHLRHQRRGEPVVQVDGQGGPQHRQCVAGGGADHQLGQREHAQAAGQEHRHVQQHRQRADLLHARHQVVAQDQPGKDAGEEAAEVAVRRVGVVLVGQPGHAGVEVVAVLGAAHAGLALRVGDADEGRLPVQPLYRQQRADAGAPAALALVEQPADEGRAHRAQDQRCGGHTIEIEQQLAADHPGQQQRDAQRVGLALGQALAGPALAQPEPPRQLVAGGQRAKVAPQPRREHEHQRQHRHHQAPEQRQAEVRLQHQQCGHREGADHTQCPQQPPGPAGQQPGHLGEIGEGGGRGTSGIRHAQAPDATVSDTDGPAACVACRQG